MELYPARSVLGYAELAWVCRQWLMKRRSGRWLSGTGIIEGYELLEAGGNGWFVILYSYKVGEDTFAGQFRIWILFTGLTREEKADKLIRRFPRGSSIQLRVNPQSASQSVAIY